MYVSGEVRRAAVQRLQSHTVFEYRNGARPTSKEAAWGASIAGQPPPQALDWPAARARPCGPCGLF